MSVDLKVGEGLLSGAKRATGPLSHCDMRHATLSLKFPFLLISPLIAELQN
jgi:hypothetical protein